MGTRAEATARPRETLRRVPAVSRTQKAERGLANGSWWTRRFVVGKRDVVIMLSAAIAGAIGSLTISRLGGAAWSAWATPVLWMGMVSGSIYVLIRTRPVGLFHFKPQDLTWGIFFAAALRLLQGAISGANGLPFPSAASLGMSTTDAKWFLQLLLVGTGGSMAEELFFRGVVLVMMVQFLRSKIGQLPAIATAVLVSSGAFTLLHTVFNPLPLKDSIQLLILGLVCSLLVILTGRFWPALFVHATYNISFILLIYWGSRF